MDQVCIGSTKLGLVLTKFGALSTESFEVSTQCHTFASDIVDKKEAMQAVVLLKWSNRELGSRADAAFDLKI